MTNRVAHCWQASTTVKCPVVRVNFRICCVSTSDTDSILVKNGGKTNHSSNMNNNKTVDSDPQAVQQREQC